MKDALGWLVAIGGGHDADGRRRRACSGSAAPRWRVCDSPRAGRSCRACASADRAGRRHRRRQRALGAGAARRRSRQRARRGDARRGRRRRRRQQPGDDDRRSDHRSRRGDRRREHRARSSCRRSPRARTSPIDLDDTVIARMDGSPFRGQRRRWRRRLSRRLEQWSRTVTDPHRVRKLDRATRPAGRRWCVARVGARRRPARAPSIPIDAALRSRRRPACDRSASGSGSAGCSRRSTGPASRAAARCAQPGRGVGVHDRHRPDARGRRLRRAGARAVAAQGRRPSLRLFAEADRRARSSAPTS